MEYEKSLSEESNPILVFIGKGKVCMRLKHEGYKLDKEANFPKANNYLDNLGKKRFSSIILPIPPCFFCTELFIPTFISATSTELSR